ncbi:MFS transporter [Ferrimonas aestuarii]|uniref:MFS transporter n=1 Tax=Ferrimonas aestuarii TaxID=2569539 RepID=A0A4U1BM37_9GAMM|nr:MFS transporter [Ferrimonas aestuarii]TKB51748.1 MFS transporter [Ferrimonas aestuarii]
MKRYPTSKLILFSLINLPLSMLMSPTAAILPNYYLEYTAISASALATVMLLMRLFDAVTDPLIGLISDRLGKRKPLMAVGVLMLLASVYPLFQPPSDVGFLYLLLWYLTSSLGWTLIEIPHSTLTAALSDDYHERNRVVVWRQMMGFIGGILFMTMPMLLVGVHKFSPDIFRAIAWVIIIGLPTTLLLLWRITPETHCNHQRPHLMDLWHLWHQLPILRHFMVTQVLFGLATGGISGMFVIYANHYLNLGEDIAMIGMPMPIMTVLSLPIWTQVLKRIEKHHGLGISALFLIISLLFISTIEPGEHALRQMQYGMAAIGCAVGLSSLVLPSMLADLLDYDRWRNRRERGATLFAIQALVFKLNQGVGGAAALGLAVLYGFNGKEVAAADGMFGLQLGFLGWPILLLLPTLALIKNYRLGQQAQQALIRRLNRRKSTKSA